MGCKYGPRVVKAVYAQFVLAKATIESVVLVKQRDEKEKFDMLPRTRVTCRATTFSGTHCESAFLCARQAEGVTVVCILARCEPFINKCKKGGIVTLISPLSEALSRCPQ